MLSYRNPVASDLPALVALWNDSFGPEWPLTERLLRQTMECDPYYEPETCWVACDGQSEGAGSIVGWVLAKTMRGAGPEAGRFVRHGGIGALCVAPQYRRRGIATELLCRVEAIFALNEIPMSTLYYPHHLLPGIPAGCGAALALFKAHEYSGFNECSDLTRELEGFDISPKAAAAIAANPGVELRPARQDEVPALIAFVENEFPGGWTYSTRGHFERGGKPSDFVIAVENGAVIGFCHTADFNSAWLLPSTYWFPLLGEKYGGLGPIGIAQQHRKRGLGLALFAASVQNLKERGVERMAIDWTTLVTFYEQLGFRVWKRYLQAQRH